MQEIYIKASYKAIVFCHTTVLNQLQTCSMIPLSHKRSLREKLSDRDAGWALADLQEGVTHLAGTC